MHPPSPGRHRLQSPPAAGLLTASAAALMIVGVMFGAFGGAYSAWVAAPVVVITFVLLVRRTPVACVGVWLAYLMLEAELARRGISQGAVSVGREAITGSLLVGSVGIGDRGRSALQLPLLGAAVSLFALLWISRSPSLIPAIGGSRYYVAWPLLGLAAWRLVRTEARLFRLLTCILVLAVPVALYGISQYVTGYGGSFSEADPEFMRAVRFGTFGAVGTTYGRPHFGMLMGVVFLISIWLTLSRRSAMSRRLGLVVALIFLVGCVVSLNRSVWVSVVGASLALGVTHLRLPSRALLGVVVVPVALSFAIAGPAPGYSNDAFGRATSDLGSFGARVEIWRDVALPLLASPSEVMLGRGPGVVGGPLAIGARDSLLPVADSTYIRVLVELGVSGLVALGLAICLLVKAILRLRVQQRSLGIALVVLFTVASVTLDAIQISPAAPLIWVAMGALLGAGDRCVPVCAPRERAYLARMTGPNGGRA